MRYDSAVPGRVRLDRALSKLGVASRTRAQELIRDGKVRVDGRVVTDPERAVVPETAAIAVDGERVRPTGWRTIALHKPRGVVTTRHDPQHRPTVYDVVGPEADRLVTVGRLDMASTGLLLLTSDTRLAAWLTDPAHAVVRRYIVTARGEVTDDDVRRMTAGIDDLRAQHVTVRKRSKRETHLEIALTEGRNREIRRLLEACGHEVTRLLRIAYGGIELGALPAGAWRTVAREEISASFGPKCDQWIDRGRAARGHQPGEERHRNQHRHGRRQRQRIVR